MEPAGTLLFVFNDFFFCFAQVTEVRLPHDQGGGKPKGFGYAEFEDLPSLTNALSLNNEVGKYWLYLL